MVICMQYNNPSELVCNICPHACSLKSGETGKCHVIKHNGSTIENVYSGKLSQIAVDIIEKRPFFHFLPGSKFLSVGFYGCSFHCGYCMPGETLISVPGGLKRIDQIQDGEQIIAVDDSCSDPQPVLAHVGHVHNREAQEVIELEVDGQTIQLTSEHPVLTRSRGWVKAVDLTVDDEVLCDKTY